MSLVHRPVPLWLPPLVLFGLALALYVATAPQGMIMEAGLTTDTAELQRMANRLGIAHSTGYPLYTMVAFVAARVGEALGASPYAFINYVSALFSALGMAAVYLALSQIAHRAVAFMGVLTFMVINSVWHFSTVAEVHGLQLAISAALLWLCLRLANGENNWKTVVGIAFLFGIGLANHRMILLYLPAIVIALWSGRVWRWISTMQVGIVVVALALPLSSYAYLYVRAATNPNAVTSTRATAWGHGMDSAAITALIRGSFSEGEGLEGNLSLLTPETFSQRLGFIYGRVTSELGVLPFWLGLAGLATFFLRRWKWGTIWTIHGVGAWLMLMAWNADDKSIIYQYHIYLTWIGGLVGLCGVSTSVKWTASQRHAALLLSCLPLAALALHLFISNLPSRDLHDYDSDRKFIAQLSRLPDQSVLYTRSWAQEIFVALEYQDNSGRNGLEVLGVYNHFHTIDRINAMTKPIYFLRRSWVDRLGLDSGATWFTEDFGLAFSGTFAPTFLEARPKDDPRLVVEAEAATPLEAQITPEIVLANFTLQQVDDTLEVTLYWRADSPPSLPYRTYVHLRAYEEMCVYDETRLRLIANDDSPAPVDGTMPTLLWKANTWVKDTYQIVLPPNETLAPLALVIGMTNAYTGERINETCLPLVSVLPLS